MSTAKEVFDEAVRAWNANDEARLLALVSPDVELTSSGGLNYRGIDGFRQWYELWAEACPDRIIRYHNVVGEGDQLIGEGTFTGTHTGILHLPTAEVAPTGRHLTADYVAVVRVSNGKLNYLRHYFDVMDLMTQLGLVGAEAKL